MFTFVFDLSVIGYHPMEFFPFFTMVGDPFYDFVKMISGLWKRLLLVRLEWTQFCNRCSWVFSYDTIKWRWYNSRFLYGLFHKMCTNFSYTSLINKLRCTSYRNIVQEALVNDMKRLLCFLIFLTTFIMQPSFYNIVYII